MEKSNRLVINVDENAPAVSPATKPLDRAEKSVPASEIQSVLDSLKIRQKEFLSQSDEYQAEARKARQASANLGLTISILTALLNKASDSQDGP